ncbi:cyclic nucleotide-binding-like protein [Chytridium lagenaria]|nr:cyclic nucleotide-binding-like protein [Chytridium lagenaria]
MRSFLSVSVASSGVFGVSGHRLRGPFSKRTSVSSTRSTSLKRAPDRLIDEDPDQSLPFPSRTASRNLPLKTDSCRIFLEDASYHTSLSSVQKSFDGPSSHFLDVRPRLPPRTPSIRSAKNISTSDITFSTLDEALEPFENHWTWAEKAWIIVTTFYLEYVRIARYNELGDPIRAGPQRRILMDEAILGEEDAICLHPLSMFVAYWDLALFGTLFLYFFSFITIPCFNLVWMIFSMVLPFIAAFDLPLDMTLTFTYMFTNPLILRASRRLQTNMGHSIMNIIVFMSLLMMFIHFNACVIYIAQKLGLPYDIEPPENVPYTQFETVKKWVKLEADGEPLWSQYILLPSDRSEQFVITFFSIAGALIYALLVGTIASFSLGLDSAGRKFTEVLDEVNEFMDASDLPESIRYKIRSFFRLKYRGKYFKKGSIMAELIKEILLESFCDLIDRVPFFRNDSDNPNSPFVCCVANVVTIEHYVAGNNVFVQGDQGDAMFFISQGTVDIVVGGNKVGALGEGAFFGEVALLDAAPRSATITASSSVELVRLGKSDLELILEDFPDVRERMKEVYQERLKRIERERAMAK